MVMAEAAQAGKPVRIHVEHRTGTLTLPLSQGEREPSDASCNTLCAFHLAFMAAGEGTGPLGEHGLVAHAVLVGADGHQEQFEGAELDVFHRVDALRHNGGHGAAEE